MVTTMDEKILDKPTVGDLVAFLSTLPQDMPIIIEDADTNWTIDKIHITRGKDGPISMWGSYPEMTSS